MLLGNLLNLKRKKYRNIFLNGISFDTRNIKKKDIFFSIKGKSITGDKFINEAILKGASGIISEKKQKRKNNKIHFI